ncbi:MAG TPA: TetR/AcrR family transcriptional regulator [Hansschlegelia sp.]
MLKAAQNKAPDPINRIVTAVCDVLAEEGVANLTLRKVAEKAGATIGLITHHFPNRHAMVMAAVEMTWEAERRAAKWPRRPDREAVLRAMEAFLPLDERRRRELSVWIAFWALTQTSRELQSVHSSIHRYACDKHIQWISGLGYGSEDARLLAERLIMLNDGLLLYSLLDSKHWSSERQKELIVHAVDEIFARAPTSSAPTSKEQTTL